MIRDTTGNAIPQTDVERVRQLAGRVRQACDSPENTERRASWRALHDLKPARPMILIEAGEIASLTDFTPRLTCEHDLARSVEQGLVQRLWRFEELRDDWALEPTFDMPWQIEGTNFGIEEVVHRGESGEHGKGSYNWDPPIKDFDADFSKLRHRSFTVDRQGTLDHMQCVQELLGDALTVRLRGGVATWSYGLTNHAIRLIGLEGLMLAMFDNPDGLHRVMRFLCDDFHAHLDWMTAEGLLTLNNQSDYVGSGSCGYVSDLPAEGFDPHKPARPEDLWILSESQETVGVSPEFFAEFIFPYQRELIERFGLCYYGCCEPVNNRWHVLRQLPNLRSVSVSPWADEQVMAEACGRDYVYSRKPNPTLISTETFDEDAIRADLRNTLDVAAGCNVEIIMKDVHTLRNQLDRASRWIQLARQAVDAVTA